MRRNLITVGLSLLFTVAFCGYWLSKSNSLPTFGDSYEIRADVPRTSSLVPGTSVRMAGLEVGHVTAVTRKGGIAQVTMKIDRKHTPIPADSRVGVRLRTLIGENYASIYPGRSATKLDSGATLPLSQAEDYVDVDEILSVLQGDTRKQAQQMIRGLGAGVKGRGAQLNAFVRDTTRLTDSGVRLVDTLGRDRKQVSRLVDNFGRVMQSVGERGGAVRDTARGLRETFVAVSERDKALREVFKQMPQTLGQLETTSNVVRSTTGTLSPTLTNLAAAVRAVGPAVKQLRPAAAEGRDVLRQVSATAPPLSGTLKRVRNLAGPTAAALPQVRNTLCELVPALDYVAPYGRDIASFAQNVLSSAANYYDATGHALRLGVSLAETAVMATPKVVRDASQKLFDTGILSKLHLHGYDPYPGSGNVGNLKKGAGVKGPDDWPYKYERIEAAC